MYTYLDLLKRGPLVIQFAERALELMRPFSSDLRVRPWYQGLTQGHISIFDQRAQHRVWNQILSGELESIQIAQRSWEAPSEPPQINMELRLATRCNYRSYQRLQYLSLPEEYVDQGIVKSLSLAINQDLIVSQHYRQLFDTLVDLGIWTVKTLDAVYGFLSLGSFQGGATELTSYEDHHGLDYVRDVERQLRDKCRGVFHVSFLTEGHIAALEGIASPVLLPTVTSIKSMQIRQDHDLLVLGVGEAETLLDDAQVRMLEEHIRPILLSRPAQVMVDLLNPDVAQEIKAARQELENLLSPSRIVTIPNGGLLVFRQRKEDDPNHSQQIETSRHIFNIYQRCLKSVVWGGPVFGSIYQEWIITRIGTHGKHVKRMPYMECSSLVDVKPFETTLWFGSKLTKRVKQDLDDLLTKWASFRYPDYAGLGSAIDILDITFRKRKATVRVEIRNHQGLALATLISMLDLFSLKQARIETLVLGQIEGLDSLLAEAG
jgi:hypothetical protein